MTTHDRSLRSRRDGVIARKGTRAVGIRVTEPPGTDAVADREVSNRGSDANDSTFELMTGHEGVDRHAPVVVPQVLIAVTDAAVRYRDLHLVHRNGTHFVFERRERCTRFQDCSPVNRRGVGHVRVSVLNLFQRSGAHSIRNRVHPTSIRSSRIRASAARTPTSSSTLVPWFSMTYEARLRFSSTAI